MEVTVEVVGDKQLIARLQSMPPAVQQALYVKVVGLALKLENYVKREKLSGQVLKRKSGALMRSISNKVQQSTNAVMGYVFSAGDVKYAGIQEFGGRTPPHEILPKKARVLRFIGRGGDVVFARKVNHPGSMMPERSFMRSSLRDMASEISTEMKISVVKAVQAQMKGS